jgi:hypothetical protein
LAFTLSSFLVVPLHSLPTPWWTSSLLSKIVTEGKNNNTRNTIDQEFDLESRNEKSRLDKITGLAYIEAVSCELDTCWSIFKRRRLCLRRYAVANEQLE